jgi:amino acid transporter
VSISEKLFWIVNHLSVWMLLPIMISVAASVVISGNSVEIAITSTFVSQLHPFGHLIALLTIFIIVFICMNNFRNIFLGSETMKKILHKPEEQTYKKILVVYLSVTGSLICFCNNVVIANVPLSVLVLLLEIIYIIALLMIHPYKQSLRVHSITLLINQCVYLVFLIFINLINFVKGIDEILVLMMGYFITGCCGVLVLLTAVRLYYELRYGEALEKQIQMEREKEEELQKKLKKEKLEKMKKQLESDARKKQSQKEIERQRNQFLYENQAK